MAQSRCPALFPISAFSIVMGLTGAGIAWAAAERAFGLPAAASTLLKAAGAVSFVAFALLYLAKLAAHRQEVVRELRHPVKLNFFPTVPIGLLLLSLAGLDLHAGVSAALFYAGAALQLALTLYVLSVWIHHSHFEIHHVSPAWFIPVVGNIVVPLPGVHHAPAELSWFFFSVGLLFWLVLLTINFYRFIFHQPLPERLLPTLFILLAPPAVGFLAYLALAGGLDPFARLLFYTALFLFLLLLAQAGRFLRIRFGLGWWAYSFPLAALASAALRFQQLVPAPALRLAALLTLGLLTGILVVLAVGTVRAALRGEICVEDG